MPRLFVAIDLPERIRDDIGSIYRAIPGARWMEDEKIHLTLRFIGEVDTSTEDTIISALQKVSCPPFSLSIKGVGFFPPRREPRVLWVGVQENKILLMLQNRIETILTSLKLESDQRKFQPHITIARLNEAHRDKIAQFISENNLFSTESFEVSEFILYRSYLGKGGSHYIKEAIFKLQNDSQIG